MKLTMVGTGYVGLVTGACFAETGNHVTCLDVDARKIEKLKRGESPIYEPGLSEMLLQNIKSGRITFTLDKMEAYRHADTIFICVGTPSDEDGSADLSYVLNAAADIGKLMTDYKVLVDKSTVPVGTAEKVAEAVKKHAKVDFDVVSNPEFLKEGAAVQDFEKPDRIVIGTESDRAREVMEEVYAPFVRTGKPILNMSLRSSEMSKYASNAMLATKISFINEVATLCEKVGADVESVRQAMSADSRIGPK